MANETERAREIEDAIKKADAEKARKDAEQGEMMDKCLSALDSISKRMDAWEEKEKAKADAEAKASEESDPKEVVADADNGDVGTGAPMEPKMDSVRKIYVDAHGDPAPNSQDRETRNVYRDAALSIQYEANRTYSALGTAALTCVEGTSIRRYDAFLVSGMIKHSKKWAELDASALERMDPTTFKNVKAEVYADAYASATDKNRGCEGDQLREYVTTDAAGRRIVNFAGESKMWLQHFAGNRQRLVGIRNG